MRVVFVLEEWATAVLPGDRRWVGVAVVRFALGLAPWGALFAVAFAALGVWPLAISLALAALGVAAAIPALKVGRSPAWCGHLMTASLVQSLMVPAWFLGGTQAACVPWLALCVVMATLFSGRVAGAAWAVVATALVGSLYAAQLWGVLPTPTVPDPVVWTLAATAHAGLLAVTLAMVWSATDVIERGRAELERARAEAELADRAKSDFLARMSHELRTPLNAILGYAELLREDADEHTARDLTRIHSAGDHLARVIDDVLDLAKVEAGRMDFDRREVDIRALVEDAAGSMAPMMARGRNHLVTELSGDARAWADELRLKQCLVNLLGNAAKFTTEGEVRVVVRDDGDRVFVEVHDSGIGMTDEQLGRVFEPFAQATTETARTHGGTGLGLAIVRQFAERMGGRVSATSRPSAGSVFTIELERARR